MSDPRPAGRSRIVIVDAAALPGVGATLMADLLRDAVGRRGAAGVALAGGQTPAAVYRELAARRVAWDRVALFFGDERAVPPHDERSNYRMARAALLDRLPGPPAAVHRMEAERADLDRAAADYAARLPDRLDLVVLGIGEDGHTASLFPGSPLLDERVRAVAPATAPTPPHRLTITPPVIAAARETLVIATGARKAESVRRALAAEGDVRSCPARLAREGRWLLDREAAARLDAAP